MQMTEQAVRRLARREGYVLRKSRSRDPDNPSYGGYLLIEPERNLLMLGGGAFNYSADLDEVVDWLKS